MLNATEAQSRLEEIRAEIMAESVSYGELAELADLADRIDLDDVLLLQWAGVPECHNDGSNDDYEVCGDPLVCRVARTRGGVPPSLVGRRPLGGPHDDTGGWYWHVLNDGKYVYGEDALSREAAEHASGAWVAGWLAGRRAVGFNE